MVLLERVLVILPSIFVGPMVIVPLLSMLPMLAAPMGSPLLSMLHKLIAPMGGLLLSMPPSISVVLVAQKILLQEVRRVEVLLKL